MIPSVALAADADRAVVDMILTGIFRFTRMAAHADRASIGMAMPLSHTYTRYTHYTQTGAT